MLQTPSALPVSVVVLAKNEEANIKRCIDALGSSDDVVVVDDHSTDRTSQLAEESGARVVRNRFASFAAQRNWAMAHAELKYDWILHVDADEVATPKMWREVEAALTEATPEVVAFRMCRRTMMDETWLKYADGFPVWIVRLVRNGHVAFEDQGHGEKPVPSFEGDLGTIHAPLLHYAFGRGLAEWIDKHNRYSSLEAELELCDPPRMDWKQVLTTDRAAHRDFFRVLSRRLPLRPALRMLYHLVLMRGFLDGRAGFQYSKNMAMYERWIVLKRRELARHSGGSDTA